MDNKNYYVIESQFLYGTFKRSIIFRGTLKECSEEVDYQRKRLVKYYGKDELHEHNFYIISEEDINKDLKKVYDEY